MELLQSLERSQREMEARQRECDRLQQEARVIREEAEAFRHRTEEEIGKIFTHARAEAQIFVQQAREDLRGLINEFKSRGRTDVHRLEQAIRAEEQRISRWGWTETPPGQEGPSPRGNESSSDLAGEGTLGEGKRGGLPKRPRGKDRERSTKPAGFIHYQIPCAARELNVIGLRVEEAFPVVDKAIDEAFLAGLKQLDVIHGAGSGRLRQAIREHLRTHVFVKAFQPGGPGRGGDGVTVVEISPAPKTGRFRRRSGREGIGQS